MKKDKLTFEILSGSPNGCIAINETRITSAKLYGFGHVIRSFTVSKSKIEEIIKDKDIVKFHLLNHGLDGVFIDGVRITTNGKKEEYQTYLEKREKQLKSLKKHFSNKKAMAYYNDGSEYVVRTKDINDIIGR